MPLFELNLENPWNAFVCLIRSTSVRRFDGSEAVRSMEVRFQSPAPPIRRRFRGKVWFYIRQKVRSLLFSFTYWKLSLLSSFVFRFCWFYCGLELRMLKPGILREVMKVEYLLTRASTIRSSNRGRDQVEKYIPLLPRFIMSRRRQGVVIIKEGRCLVFLRRTRMLWNNLSGFT